ncbi:NACHT domain-containing protein [Streptomyces sp. NPDC093510]|uniref:NACHT domain-containing protein n=1 Tax=Streptomyces sp. NPDC093510 TaxID=3155199 RepID=UPI00341F73DC
MPGALRYTDAVRLLGGNGPAFDVMDRVVGGALTAVTGAAPESVLALLGADAQLARLSRSLLSDAVERVHGLGRFERTERLAAAHAVIVVAAYSDALARVPLPFDVRELAVTRTDSVRLATGDAPESHRLVAVADHLLRSQLPLPSPHEPYEVTLAALYSFYVTMSGHVETYVSGLAAWDRLPPAEQLETRASMREHIPHAALSRYEEMFRQLAVDFPDVGSWADRVDHRATRTAVRRLEEAVTQLADGQLPISRLTTLLRAGSLPYNAPLLGTEETAAGLTIPSLREAYISPDFKVAEFGATDRLSSPSWWKQEVRHGLDTFFEAFLTAPKAVEVPVVLMGHPGSGKSVLTKVLAARLPPEDFLVVRIPLRDVPADSGLQDQIEAAIRQATGEPIMGWADIVRAAGTALPVVLLDGFDELLQATGVHQSDYLEKVANFQRREASLGRPLAIVVTSRTAVADRARLTTGGIAIHLESFSAPQIEQWLEVWNRTNADYFNRHGLRPLMASQALTQAALASQPLLLLMLALYDAEDNAYQQEVGTLLSYELYERLLTRFARREVLKHEARLNDHDLKQAVEHDLLRLSVAAFGMFNRDRQWITEEELEDDLGSLLPQQAPHSAGLRAALTRAQTIIGRFFFIHRAEAFRNDVRLQSYEFLHSTFGEFLVARLITHELQDFMTSETERVRRVRRPRVDDSFLYALLSFASCTGRGPVMAFLAESLRPLPPSGVAHLSRLLLQVLHESLEARPATSYASYQPSTRSAAAAPAFYYANMLVLVLTTRDELSARELFPASEDPVLAWRATVLLLESQLREHEWRALADRLRLERLWAGRERSFTLRMGKHVDSEQEWKLTAATRDSNPVDPFWIYSYGPGTEERQRLTRNGWRHTNQHAVKRDAYIRCDPGTDALLDMAQALDEFGLGLTLTSYAALPEGDTVSCARLLLRLWGAGATFSAAHRDALWATGHAYNPMRTEFLKLHLSVVLRQWELAGRPVPRDWVSRAHDLFDTHDTAAASHALGEAFDSLLDELPRPPRAPGD